MDEKNESNILTKPIIYNSISKDSIVIKFNNGYYLELHFSDAEISDENCDSMIDCTIYDMNIDAIDGGQMEYNSEECVYDTIRLAIPDVIDFIMPEHIRISSYSDTGFDNIDDLEDSLLLQN